MVSERLSYEESSREPVSAWLGAGDIAVRVLTTSDIPAFRALRLDALRLHPESFVPTYEEERSVNGSSVASKFRNDWIKDGNFILGAYRNGWLVGAIGVKRWPRQKQRHKATVWLLYTHADIRGQGTGRQLLVAAIDCCRRDPEIEMVHLSVGRESTTARHLYTSLGFQSYGVEPRALKLDECYYIDVEMMALDVDSRSYHH
jgi:GNAT superfamily N-acetyltransferase